MKRSSVLGGAVAAVVLTVLAAPSVASAVTSGAVLDQSATATNCDLGVSNTQSVAQTFTAGITGSVTDVVISIGNSSANSALHVSITAVAGGAPDNSTVLATSDVPTADVVGGGSRDYDVAFATPAQVVAGTTYAITATTAVPGWWLWYCAGSSTYAGGTTFADVGGGWLDQGLDSGFATYVLTPSAPTTTSRMGYCSVAGDTWASGVPIPVGTFLDLASGQPAGDPHFGGATPANYVSGEGITCDRPPPGWTQRGWAGPAGVALDAGGIYPYYVAAG